MYCAWKRIAENVASLFARLQPVHAVEVAVFEDRAEILDVAADARDLQKGGVIDAVMRIVGVAELVVGVGERRRAGIDALQRVLPLNAAAEGQRLEERGGSRAEGGDRALLERIGEADAMEAVPDQVVGRDGEAGGGLVVVLHQRLLGGRQVAASGRDLVVLRGVVVVLAGEDLEAERYAACCGSKAR